MSNENEIISTLRTRLTDNLVKVDYNGPQKFLSGVLVDLLMDMLLGILDGCFSASGNLNNAKVRKVNVFQKMKLKRELIREVYEGSSRLYRINEGDKVREALVVTIEGSDETEQDVLLNYVETESKAWTPTDYKWR